MKKDFKQLLFILLAGLGFIAPNVVDAQCNLITSMTKTDALCYGGATGTATVSVSGGIAPYTYTWNTAPVQYTATAINLAASTKTVTVKDASGCTATASVTIAQPSVIALALTKTDVSCNAGTNGTATVAVTGGIAPYTYTWSITPAQYTATALGLTAGAKTVTVRDANNCAKTGSVTLLQPAAITSTAAISNVTCNAGNNGSITVTAATGVAPYTYTWNTNPIQYGQTVTGLTAAAKTVTIKDANGCSKAFSYTVTQPAAITATATITNVTCNGGNNGSITVTAAAGVVPYTYTWNTTPVQYGQTATGLTAAPRSVTIKDANGCSKAFNYTVTQPVAITVAVSQTNVSCYGGNNGSATVTAANGVAPYTYTWNTTPVQYGATAIGLTAGTKTVTIKGANGCTKAQNVTITQAATLAATLVKTDVSCFGGNNGSAAVSVVSGGTAPYTFTWNTNPAQYTQQIGGLVAGTYTCTIKSAAGCSLVKSIAVTQPTTLLNATTTSVAVSCAGGNNGTATVVATGGVAPYTYTWAGTPTQYTATATNLLPGTTMVNVKDAKGCVLSKTVTIGQPTPYSFSANYANVACNGTNTGSIDLSVSGATPAYTYIWSNGATTQDINNLAAGTYSVNVTDSKGCVGTFNVSLSQPSAVSATVSTTSPSCGTNGTASVSVSGGVAPYYYSWATTPAQYNSTATNLLAGTYNCYITDSYGCSLIKTATIAQGGGNLALTVTQTNVSCNGGNNGSATATVTGGGQPYAYTWNTNPPQYAATATNLVAGSYSVVVSTGACSASASINISQPAGIVTSYSQTNINCFGGTNGAAYVAVAGGVAPYVFSWNTTPAQFSQQIANMPAGTFTCTITDANNCTTSRSVTLTQPATALTSAVTQTNVSCANGNNGTATVTAAGGVAPYTYTWATTPTKYTTTVTALTAGTRNVIVVDANGCSISKTFTITQPAGFAMNTQYANPSCSNSSNGSIAVTISGATPPYTYSWNNSATTSNISGLAAGSYVLYVTDANGCPKSYTIPLTAPAALAATTSQTNTSGGNNGTASVTASGGTPTYYYQWNTNPAQYTSTATNLGIGNYVCMITDSHGCTLTKNFSISTPPSLTGGNGSNETEGNQNNPLESSFAIFPNPNEGNFQLAIRNFAAEEVNFTIFTLSGQLVYQQQISEITPNSLKEIEGTNLAKGIYMVRIEAAKEGKVETMKMIVE